MISGVSQWSVRLAMHERLEIDQPEWMLLVKLERIIAAPAGGACREAQKAPRMIDQSA
jgi:hypothetical protein